LCETAIKERALSRHAASTDTDDLGLRAALQWLAASSEDSGCMIEVDVGDLPRIDSELSTSFPVAQKHWPRSHAPVKHVVMRRPAARTTCCCIVDDGCGCDVERASRRSSESESSGLPACERVNLFGGQLELISQPGEGLQLRVRLPLTVEPGES
jgi:signal transduction histidine kinase